MLNEANNSHLLELSKMEDTSDSNRNENSIIYCIDSYMLKELWQSDSEYSSMWVEQYADNDPFYNYPESLVTSGLILSGVGENAEKEKYVLNVIDKGEEGISGYSNITPTKLATLDCPTKGNIKLDIGMEAVDHTGSNNVMQGKEIQVKVIVQAMQYRNTSNATWENVFEEEFIYGF